MQFIMQIANIEKYNLKRFCDERSKPIWDANKLCSRNQDIYCELEIFVEEIDELNETNEESENVAAQQKNKVNNEEKMDLNTYIKVITTVHSDINVHTLKAVSEDKIEIRTLSGHVLTVHINNFHGYFKVGDQIQCRVCRVMVEGEETHKVTITHMKLIMKPLADKNCIRQIGIWNHCILCNEIVDNIEFHAKYSKTHGIQLRNALLKSLDKQNADAQSNYDYIEKENCNGNMRNDRKQKNIDSLNKQDITSNEYCKACNINLHPKDVKNHYDGKKHLNRIASAVIKGEPRVDHIREARTIRDVLSENVNEDKNIFFKNGTKKTIQEYRCSLCDVLVPNNPQNILIHNKGKPHKLKASIQRTSQSAKQKFAVASVLNTPYVSKETAIKTKVFETSRHSASPSLVPEMAALQSSSSGTNEKTTQSQSPSSVEKQFASSATSTASDKSKNSQLSSLTTVPLSNSATTATSCLEETKTLVSSPKSYSQGTQKSDKEYLMEKSGKLGTLSCKICRIEIPQKNVNEHFLTKHHMTKYNNVLLANKLEQSGERLYCKTCDIVFLSQCLIDHISRDFHKNKLTDDTKSVKVTENVRCDTEYSYIMKNISNDRAVECKVCFCTLPKKFNNIREHLLGRSHKKIYQELMFTNGVILENDKMFCSPCKVHINEFEEILHILANTHKVKLKISEAAKNLLETNVFATKSNVPSTQSKTSVTKSNSPITQSSASITQPSRSIASSSASITQLSSSIAQSSASITQPNRSIAQSSASVTQPNRSIAQSSASFIQPSSSIAQSNTSITQPSRSIRQRNISIATSNAKENSTDISNNIKNNVTCHMQESKSKICNVAPVEPKREIDHFMLKKENSYVLKCKVCKIRFRCDWDVAKCHLENIDHLKTIRKLLNAEGIQNNGDKFFCLFCYVNVKENDLFDHIGEDENSPNYLRHIIQKPVAADSVIPPLTLIDNYTFLCQICKRILTNSGHNMVLHINDKACIEKCDTENKLSVRNTQYFCEPCNVYLNPLLRINHVFSWSHRKNLEESNALQHKTKWKMFKVVLCIGFAWTIYKLFNKVP